MSETHETQINTEEGNNHTSSTYGDFRCRKYIFTLNNYTNTETQDIRDYLKDNSSKWIFGYEMGEQGTPHLQGYMEFKNPKKWSVLIDNGFKRCWSRKARGNLIDNYNYTSKEGNYEYGGFKIENLELENLDKDERKKYLLKKKKEQILKNIYKDVEWKQWQTHILNIINGEKNNRTINWIHEPNGNKGKSFLTKYIFCKLNGIIINGKVNDIFNNLLNYQEENDYIDPDFIIIDIPRSSRGYNEHLYTIMEKIKDGLIYSGKYEGGTILYEKPPHIIVLSNDIPTFEKMSDDRWNIISIDYFN